MVKGVLVLEDGNQFEGELFGAVKAFVSGEVVFNTGMVGYVESMTDPSYCGQILVFTYPLIGNYGVPDGSVDTHGLLKYFESSSIHLKAIVVSSLSDTYSHWNAKRSLSDWMKEKRVIGISGIDTRHLTKHLRDKGVMLGRIEAADSGDPGNLETKGNIGAEFYDPNKENLVSIVSCKEVKTYGVGESGIHIVAVDCGIKYNIVRCFLKLGVKVTVVPWDYDFVSGLENGEYDALFLSNGPGDPSKCNVTIENIRKVMAFEIVKPILGICLGNQLLSIAAGATTYKMKFGHRGQNQPCQEIMYGNDGSEGVNEISGRCYITSQNHGYAVDSKSLPSDWRVWFVNANDGTNEGIRHDKLPFMSVQFHPEAAPGPEDTEWIFEKFVSVIKEKKSNGTLEEKKEIDGGTSSNYEPKSEGLLNDGGETNEN